MRVTVTGGAGFIGSHLVDRLLAGGHQVVVIDDFSSGRQDNLGTGRAGLTVIRGDVADAAAIGAALDGTQAVFHLAAVASVQASIEDPIAAHRTNAVGTLTLLEAARGAGVTRVVYASSAAVYGDACELPIGEEVAKRPLSPYAADKLAGEHYLAGYHRRGELAGVALRLFNVYGPRQNPASPYSGVISVFLARAAAGEALTVFGDGTQTRDFVYVGDVVDTLVAALDFPLGTDLEAYNVGTGRATSLLDLIAALEARSGPLEVRHAPARPGDIRHSLADVAKLRSATADAGVDAPATSLAEGLAATAEAEAAAG